MAAACSYWSPRCRGRGCAPGRGGATTMSRRGTRIRRHVPSTPMSAKGMKVVDISRADWEVMSSEEKGQTLSQRVE